MLAGNAAEFFGMRLGLPEKAEFCASGRSHQPLVVLSVERPTAITAPRSILRTLC